MAESRLSIEIDSRSAEQRAAAMQQRLAGMEAAGDRAAQSADKVTASVSDQKEELSRLIGRINPTIGKLNDLDKMEQQLRKHHKAGLLPTDEFNEYNERIQQTRHAVSGFAEEMDKAGVSTGQTKAAMRQLPAQFTDIFTSLQGGQSPMTVFIQQGGQIKDSFGGVGPALRETAKYALALVNPFTVAAAAIAGLYVAYEAGSAEQRRFNEALIMTGNFAGVTADDLTNLSREMAEVAGTQGRAAAAITEVAASGKFTESQFKAVASAAVAMQQATGQAVSETIDQFAGLAEDPVNAAIKLNDQYHFLTESVYAQAQALQEQGREQEAAELLVNQFSATVQQRASEVAANVGLMERAWKGLTGSIAEAWNAMKGVGRSATLSDQIAALDASIASANTQVGYMDQALTGMKGTSEEQLSNWKAQRTILVAVQAMLGVSADTQARQNELVEARIKADKKVAELTSQYQTKQQRINELLERRKELESYRGTDADNGQIDDAIRAIDEHVASLRKDSAALADQRKETQLASKAQRELAQELKNAQKTFDSLLTKIDPAGAAMKAYDAQIADLGTLLKNGRINQLEYTAAVAAAAQKYTDAANAASGYTKAMALQRQEQQALAAQARSDALTVAGVGMGDQDYQRAQARLQIEQEYLQKKEALRQQYNAGDISEEDYQRQLAMYDSFAQQHIQQQQGMYAAMDVAQSDWLNGVNAALSNFQAEAADNAGNIQAAMTSALNNSADALANFVMTGKLSFSDLANSIISDLARIAAQKAIAGLVGNLLGGGGSSSGYSGGDFTSSLQFANGGHVSGPGTSSSDSIPAWLSNGEFVVNAAATRQYRPLLERINSAKGYANGGYVTNNNSTTNVSSNSASVGAPVINQSFTITGSSGDASLEERLRQAADDGAQRGATQGYQMMLQDFSRNGKGLQLARKGIK